MQLPYIACRVAEIRFLLCHRVPFYLVRKALRHFCAFCSSKPNRSFVRLFRVALANFWANEHDLLNVVLLVLLDTRPQPTWAKQALNIC